MASLAHSQVEGAVVEQLGTARKITISGTATTLIADAASKDEIEMRIAQLKKELSETDSGGFLLYGWCWWRGPCCACGFAVWGL
jgi:hypothetical protein